MDGEGHGGGLLVRAQAVLGAAGEFCGHVFPGRGVLQRGGGGEKAGVLVHFYGRRDYDLCKGVSNLTQPFL